jgi:hypothetical protein
MIMVFNCVQTDKTGFFRAQEYKILNTERILLDSENIPITKEKLCKHQIIKLRKSESFILVKP